MEYKQKLKNLDFKNAISFLSEQSINFGNKTVTTSSLIILLSLNFIVINGVEIEGVSISINVVIITLVLLIVNIYYYQQFRLYSDVDKKDGFPTEIFTLIKDAKSLGNSVSEKFKSQASRKEKINKRLQEGLLPDDEFESLINELNQMSIDLYDFGNIVKNSSMEIDKDLDNYNTYSTIKKKYSFLNISIPKVIFYLGLISVILRFIIYIYQIFSSQNDPWNYMIEDNLKYYKIIYENKIAP